MQLAHGARPTDYELAELAESPEQAQELAYRSYAARREARVMAKYGFTD